MPFAGRRSTRKPRGKSSGMARVSRPRVLGRKSAVALALLLRLRRADRRSHVLQFLGRRQHGRQPQRVEPQLAAVPAAVIEVLVLLLLDELAGLFERLLL